MKQLRMARRSIAKTLIMMFLLTSAPFAQAGLISTPETLAQVQSQEMRASLNAMLERADVSEKLLAAGVQADEVQARIDAMSDQEVAALAKHFDEMPAGGDFLTTAALIFVVLVFTDIMGYTDIFPFIKK